MPVDVNVETNDDEIYESPLIGNPEHAVTIDLPSGDLANAAESVIDDEGVLVPGAVFARLDKDNFGVLPAQDAADKHSVDGADTSANEFTLNGIDLRDVVERGDVIAVQGSTGNDGYYTVDRVTVAGGNTTLAVRESVDDGTADGEVWTSKFDAFGVMPDSRGLLQDGDSSTVSNHGKMSLAVYTEGVFNLALFDAQLKNDGVSRSPAPEEVLALANSPRFTTLFNL
jgi:hypothetical protein